MDFKKIILSKFYPPPENIEKYSLILFSDKIKHIFILIEGHGYIYTTRKNKEGLIFEKTEWQYELIIKRARFSTDGRFLLIINENNDIEIFEINQNLALYFHENLNNFKKFLSKWDCRIELTEKSEIDVVVFSDERLIFSLDLRWIVSLKWPGLTSIIFSFEMASCASISLSGSTLYSLTADGLLSAFCISSGEQLNGVANLADPLCESEQSFIKLASSQDGNLVTATSASGRLHLADVSDCFKPQIKIELTYDSSSKSDCDTLSMNSTLSISSKASTKTSSSIPSSSSFRPENSKESRVTTSKERENFKTTWENYLNNLRLLKSTTITGSLSEKERSRTYAPLSKPIIYFKPDDHFDSIRGSWLTACGLSVWFSSQTNGEYRLYDPANGRCLWHLPIPSGTAILGAALPGPCDVWLLSDHSLAIHVEHLAVDLLFSKLLQNIPIDSLAQLLHTVNWPADLSLTPASLSDRIRHGELGLAQLVFAVHRITHFRLASDRASSLDVLFELIYPVLYDTSIQQTYSNQLHALAISHLLFLIEKLHNDQSQFNFQQFEPLANQTESLKKRYIHHLTNILAWNHGSRNSGKTDIDASLTRMDSRWQDWRQTLIEGDNKAVIRETILTHSLPVLHTCYVSHPILYNSTTNFCERIKQVADEWVYQLCSRKDFLQAEDVIKAMGDDVHEHLREMCLNSFEPPLRDGLMTQLQIKDWLSKTEIESWHFIKQVESVLKNFSDTKFVHFSTQELSISQVSEKTEQWKKFVLVEIYFKTSDANIEEFIDSTNAWDYLIKDKNVKLLKDWIQICLSPRSLPIKCSTQLKNSFLQWGLSQPMINSLEKFSCSFTETLLDFLASYGRFTSTESTQVSAILSRIIRLQALESLPEILNQSTSNVSYNEFLRLMAKVLVENDIPQAAFSCLKDLTDQNSIDFDQFKNLSKNHWWHLWRVFKSWSQTPSDQKLLLSSTIASIEHFSIPKSPLVSAAVTLLEGKSLFTTFSQEDYQQELQALPLLHSAMKANNEKLPDINIYQLLQGKTPFDISKLFLWLQEKDQEEMPHFSHPRLVAKYGHTVAYDYLACLRDARPCHAAAMFISQQIEKYGKLSKKMRREACGYAHGLALQHFSEPRVSVACIAFVHLLGEDPSPIRIHTNVALTLQSYLQKFSHIHKSHSWEKLIGDVLNGLIKKKNSAEGLLNLLERAILELNIKSITEQMIMWELAVQLARLHHISLPEGFLIKCAQKDLWLPFIVFLELHQYPVDQAIKLVRHFKSSALQNHLYHALNYEVEDPPQVSAQSKLTQRDARKLLYSRIGLSKHFRNSESLSPEGSPPTANTTPPSSSDTEDDCTGSVLSVSVTGDTGVRDPSRDLFLVLLECHANADPPRALLARAREFSNPVLSILATCYEPSSTVASLCTWLVVSLRENLSSSFEQEFSKAAQAHLWTSKHLESLLEICVSQGRVATLANGFKIFLSENPLCDFTDFLMQCVLKKNFKDTLNLKLFKTTCQHLKNNPIADQTDDPEELFLTNGHWIASQAIRMTNLALGFCFNSAYQQLTFLQTLFGNGFTENLPVIAPDYEHWAKLIECLINNGTGVFVNLSILAQGGEACTIEYRRIIDELIARQHFDDAISFAELAKCSKDAIVLAQGHIESEQLLLNNQLTPAFWEKCNITFQQAKVDPINAVQFFKTHAEKITSYKDRYQVLRLALCWQSKIPSSEGAYAGLEKAMWHCWLLDKSNIPFEECYTNRGLITKTRSELLQDASLAAEVALPTFEYDDDKETYETTRLDLLITKLLDRNEIDKGCRIAAMFHHKSQDLEMLLTCLALAEGVLSPYELTSDQRLWLSEPCITPLTSFRRRNTTRQNTPRQSSTSSLTASSKFEKLDDSFQMLGSSLTSGNSMYITSTQDTIQVLENLTARISHGRPLANRIVACLRLSNHLELNFDHLWRMSNPLELLSKVNRTASADDHALASDLITASQLSKQDLSQLLADQIVEAIKEDDDKIVWGCDLETQFHMLLDLCEDPSILGEALVFRATKSSNLSLIVELLILAHEAFSAACNMEGIADILTRARTLTNTLLTKKLWPQMVRLLIGVGRYTEMSYIFQTLKDNDQFESLLGRGLFKANGFKLALLEFLRTRCPTDRELYRIAALHFGMHSELAELWESEGLEAIRKLIGHQGGITEETHLPRTEDSLKVLRHAMEAFTHAAQYYLQAEKLNRALTSAHWAELIALQISLIQPLPPANSDNRAILLLLLAPSRVSQVINNHLSYPQACIMVRAYSHPVDWGAALYSHCILQGDETYLTHFTHITPLSPSLVEEVARRYQSETQVTPTMATQMRRFVQAIAPVDIKYRVASQLGFRDILETMLNGPELAYLKDTVWRRGFSLYRYL